MESKESPSSNGGATVSFAVTPLVPSSSVVHDTGKAVVVSVRRKRNQPPLDAFWLEISERPKKRHALDLSKLTISESEGSGVTNNKIFLVQHVETVKSSVEVHNILQSVETGSNGAMALKKKLEERRETFMKQMSPNELASVAREKREELAKSARLKQIWEKRKGVKEKHEDGSLDKLYQLYDVMRIDETEANDTPVQEDERTSSQDFEAMLSFLPLLREYIPSAAEDIETDIVSSVSVEDDYEYDLYTVEDDGNVNYGGFTSNFPRVEVNDDADYHTDRLASDYETDDSNAEDNPLFDYPDDPSEDYCSDDGSYHSEDLNQFQDEDSDDDGI